MIVIADLQHGVALVPDGTPFPSIRINGRDGNPLTFATTPQASTEKMIVTHDGSVTARGARMQSDKHQHRLPICGRYGEPPCNENLDGTIDIYFP